jgi:hypothetical protein
MMGQTAHTPGPWLPVELKLGSRSFWIAIHSGGRLPETEANARLIAAAPDLLEALKAIMSDRFNGPDSEPIWRRAEAAIAKAEGRAALPNDLPGVENQTLDPDGEFGAAFNEMSLDEVAERDPALSTAEGRLE